MKRFWREYFREWKINSKKDWKENGLISAVPIINSMGMLFFDSRDNCNIVLLIVSFLLYFAVLLSILMHPIRLEKRKYLLPINDRERKKSIKGDYLKRSLLHFTLLMLGNLFTLLWGNVNLFAILWIFLWIGPVSFCLPMTAEDGNAHIYGCIFAVGTGMFTYLQWIALFGADEPYSLENLILQGIIYGTSILFLLPCYILYVKAIPVKLERAASYEGGITFDTKH